MGNEGICKSQGIPIAARITGIVPTVPESDIELRRMVANQPVMVRLPKPKLCVIQR